MPDVYVYPAPGDPDWLIAEGRGLLIILRDAGVPSVHTIPAGVQFLADVRAQAFRALRAAGCVVIPLGAAKPTPMPPYVRDYWPERGGE